MDGQKTALTSFLRRIYAPLTICVRTHFLCNYDE